jgi:DNA-binding MarR family transcriptional regulator
MKQYARPVPTAFGVLFFVFKKPRIAREIAELMNVDINRVYKALRAAEAEGLVKCAKLPRTGRADSPLMWKRAI